MEGAELLESRIDSYNLYRLQSKGRVADRHNNHNNDDINPYNTDKNINKSKIIQYQQKLTNNPRSKDPTP